MQQKYAFESPAAFSAEILAFSAGWPGRIALVFFLAFPLIYGGLSLWFGQDANWDLENYHWYNAYAFLNGRAATDLLVAQTPSFYNPLADIPFYLAATHLPARVVGFLLGVIEGLNGLLLYGLAFALLRRQAPIRRVLLSIAAATVGMVGGGALGEVGTTFWDNIVSLGLFSGLLVLVPYAVRPGRRMIWAGVAGFLVGGAAALKQPHLLYVAGIGLAVFALPGGVPRRIGRAAWFGVGGVAGILLTSGFWMIHLDHAYGSPMFPYFNTIFQSPLADIHFNFVDRRFMPKTLWAAIFYPVYFTLNPILVGEVQQRGPAFLALLFVLPIAVLCFVVRRRPAQLVDSNAFAERAISWFLLAVIAFSYLGWLKVFCIYRYAVPLEMLAPLGLLAAAGLLPGSIPLRAAAVALLLALCAFGSEPGDWHRVPWHHHYVEMTLPPQQPGTMVLMAGYEPVGFIATGFPPELPVVRIQSNFMPPYTPPTQFSEIAQARVAAHHGLFSIVFMPREKDNIDHVLPEYGLVLDDASCRNVPNSLEDGKITICGVTRAP